jgi:hypothetical protein
MPARGYIVGCSLAFIFVLAAPSMADMSDARLPGSGAFAYSGSPNVTPAPQVIVAAFR